MHLEMLIPLAFLLSAGGFAAGLHMGRRKTHRALRCEDPSLNHRLDAMERARDAAELANMEMRRALDELQLAAGTDRLTGAWNRRRFEEGAATLMALALRHRESHCLILFDLDHFKSVNDTFGHGAGDMLLTSVVQTVQNLLRASDHLARWGGEEFIVLASGTNLAGGLQLAEKIRSAVAESRFPQVGRATISLGVAELIPGERLEAWIERVDAAMYRAKNAGRNRVESDREPPLKTTVSPACNLLSLAWDDAYASRHAHIDQQHQHLFDLTNTLIASITEGSSTAELSLRLRVLMAHVAQHFHDEESELAQVGYPLLARHAKSHAHLMAEAHRLQEEVASGRLDSARLLSFLALDLVKGHILSEDVDYFPLFKNEI